MSGIQSALSQVGAAKQSAKGTANATMAYTHGIVSGQVLTASVEQSLQDLTSGTRVAPSVNRTAVKSGMDFACRAHAASAPLYFYAALGSLATTGTTPKTHTVTVGADVPYLTGFGKLASTFVQLQDLRLGNVGVSWSGNEPVEMKVTGMGTVVTYPTAVGGGGAGTWAAAAGGDDTLAAVFRPIGGTFSLAVDSATPATARVTAGEITVNNNLSDVTLSGKITPDDIIVGRTEVECSFDVTPDDLAYWRTILTGSSSGSSESGTVVYGSFSVVFSDGSNTMTLSASRVAFTCDFPSSDPAGGNVTLTLAGLCVQPAAGGTPLTVAVTNSVTSY